MQFTDDYAISVSTDITGAFGIVWFFLILKAMIQKKYPKFIKDWHVLFLPRRSVMADIISEVITQFLINRTSYLLCQN